MADAQYIIDGDTGFIGANDRDHPSRLPPGIVAEAKNCRFEHGEPWPRWAVNLAPWSHTSKFEESTLLAAARWYEPDTGEEAAVIVTNAIRSNGDGGRGVVYKVVPGGEPIVIPLNGYDCWGTCRLVPARHGLLLLRHGPKRFYIPSGNVDTGTDTITTLVAHGFISGDFVIVRDDGVTMPTPLVNGVGYWVEYVTDTELILHDDVGLASAVDLTTTGTRFIIEATTLDPGRIDFDPPTLICQGSDVSRAWDNGFSAVPQSLSATVATTATVWTAASHRLDNGQTVTLSATWGGVTAGDSLYVHFITEHTFSLHATAADALLGTSAIADGGGGATVSVYPAGYSGQPIVPMREAVVHQNRTIGINGRVRLAISDPGDLLHYTPFTGAKTAAMGNGDRLTTLLPMGTDALVLPTRSQVLAITGLSVADPSAWQLQQLTSEYGFLAPLCTFQVGRDVWGLAEPHGVMSIAATDDGQNQGRAVPVSQPIQSKIDQIDWQYAHLACGAWFGNKAFFAVPLKGQETPVNNCLLVYNFLTQAWDHYWQADGIAPKQFFRLTIAGTERLCWIDNDGSVKWFSDDGWEDIVAVWDEDEEEWSYTSTPIDSYIVTRGYTCGSLRTKKFDKAEIVIAHINPKFSIYTLTEGYNQQETYRNDITKDPAKWLTFNQSDYQPAFEPERANLPYREDYSFFLGENYGPNLLEGLSWDVGSYITVSATAGVDYAITMGNAPFISTDTTGGSPEFPDGTFTSVDATITNDTGYFLVWRPSTPTTITATIREVAEGMVLDDGTGPGPATHQTILEPVPIRAVSRMLQLKLANTQGSVRWRSVLVAAKPEHGDF